MERDVLFFWILLVGIVVGWQLCMLNMRFLVWALKRKLSPGDMVIFTAKHNELQRFLNTSIAKRRKT